MTEREFATDVVRRLRDAGFEALFAGGCVRDALLGLEPHDFDVATAARPEEVQRLFRRTIAVGVSFGVVEVLGPRPLKVQVATFRADGPYTDGRRPDSVEFCSPKEDALRRDFTVNGLFFDPLDDRLIDYVGGAADLRDRVLRAIGDPVLRFTEDRLRLLRAARIAARFDFKIESATLAAVQSMAGQVVTVSGERIAEELRKLLVHPSRSQGVALLVTTGLWSVLIPELGVLSDTRLTALGRLGEGPSFPLVFAVLVGELPPRDLHAIADRLRLSNVERDRLLWLAARRTALQHPDQLPLHVLKPLLAHPGIGELLALHRAFGHNDAVAYCEQKLAEWPIEVLDPPPFITGDDLKQLGLAPGPEFKRILDAVRNAQLDGIVTDKAGAMTLAKSLAGV